MRRAAYQTDIGRVRMINEDRAVVQENLSGLTLAIVADGMGGHQAGDMASSMAVELIEQGLQSLHPEVPWEERQTLLRETIETANEKIFEFAAQRDNYHGMGTTVVAVLADDEHAVIGHIGDSRAYLIRGESIEQITEDHSLVNELVRSGQISREEAIHHPRRNVLTRALGTEPTIEVDVQQINWQSGDLLLICSDGLSNLVEPAQMVQQVAGGGELEPKVQRLVHDALEAGGDDNITVVLLANVEGGHLHNDGEAR
ncbi:Stp1/IreP family PP2C-type Ser/Thr phosphatase [Paenibacillus cremeus]|uniref:protein-serine/threonine phosphatase n=1 Tax=Paenibacillus cremeus TaxID=2163881 RepID=A0A559K9M0_9BACL|nr:Stp1/IreP family PP2C-type Ser/Thr phosphatase [Paenibacillus cremeus]TVY08812.1 Stp1/IreP family PP2C-type Ser/Thr phosphatase [Paenibacillus cremeus]